MLITCIIGAYIFIPLIILIGNDKTMKLLDKPMLFSLEMMS